MEKSAQPAGETVQRILAAARDAFADQGFSGATVDAIARSAGVNKATLYYHIGDKETLYAEVVSSVLESNIERLQRQVAEAKTPEEQLRRYVRTVAAAVENNPWMPRIMLREMAAGGVSLPDAVLHSFARLLTTLGEILDEGARQGVFVEQPPFLVHMMIMGGLIFYKTTGPLRMRVARQAEALFRGRQPSAAEVASQVEELVLRSVRQEAGPCRPASAAHRTPKGSERGKKR